MAAYNYDPATNGDRNPFGWPSCPLRGCEHTSPHRHSGRGLQTSGAEVLVQFRDHVTVTYKPRRGPSRPVYEWTDPTKAAEWFERTAAEIRAAHDLPQITPAKDC
jgi:hypothetical protein